MRKSAFEKRSEGRACEREEWEGRLGGKIAREACEREDWEGRVGGKSGREDCECWGNSDEINCSANL